MDDLKKLPKVPQKRKKQCEPKRYNPDGSIFDPFFDDPGEQIDKFECSIDLLSTEILQI
jgi:hypothetical protein